MFDVKQREPFLIIAQYNGGFRIVFTFIIDGFRVTLGLTRNSSLRFRSRTADARGCCRVVWAVS